MAVESIFVRTTCVQQAWHGGCERSVTTCSQARVDALIDALNRIYRKIDGCDLDGLTDLKNCLQRSHTSDCVWRCASLDGAVGQTSGNEITITPEAFASSQTRLDAIVFHEMVHRCGGTELDSEAFENHCYRNTGATGPTSGDFPKFRDDGGRFVNWNGSTGAVTLKDGQVLTVDNAAFVDPDPPSDDGW